MQDFVLTYFPLHGLDPLKDFLRWWQLLVFVEGVIYQADEENEQATGNPTDAARQPGDAGLEAMEQLLQQRGLLTAGVQKELAAGRRYWQQERRLCSLMLQHPAVPEQGHGTACSFTLQDVLEASAAKSFDYRLLNHLVYALRKEEPDQLLLRFLQVDEMLVDIGDDLTDYEDDIDAGSGSGSFNIFRCFVHLWGRDAPLHMAQRVGELEQQREQLLAQLPLEQQRHVRQRQVEAASEGEGGLRWQMPPIVLDEAAFRREFAP
ncbi:hypothetical protein ACK3TF_004356 [Chlorella vulgaris]